MAATSPTSVYSGDTVTLTCEVGQSTGWSFVWYKGSQSLQSQYPADKNPNTISVTVSDAGTPEFTCEAYRQGYFTNHRYRSSYPHYYYYTGDRDPAVVTVTGTSVYLVGIGEVRVACLILTQTLYYYYITVYYFIQFL